MKMLAAELGKFLLILYKIDFISVQFKTNVENKAYCFS